MSEEKYESFTVELSKPTEVRVGSAIGLNCPDDQTRLHKVLAVRDKGDHYEADVELLLKPVPNPAVKARLRRGTAKLGWTAWWLVDEKGNLLNTEPVCSTPEDKWHPWFIKVLEGLETDYWGVKEST